MQSNIKFSTSWYYHIWWDWSCVPKVLKITSMQYLCNISRNKWVMKLIFCMLISMVFIGFLRDAQSTKTSLKYICDTSRNKLGMKLIFHLPVNMKVLFKLILSFLTGVTKVTPNTKCVQYLRNWYVHFFIWKMKVETQNPVITFSCS